MRRELCGGGVLAEPQLIEEQPRQKRLVGRPRDAARTTYEENVCRVEDHPEVEHRAYQQAEEGECKAAECVHLGLLLQRFAEPQPLAV